MKESTKEEYTDQRASQNICVSEDAFLEDKAIWVADLSNGIKVYQDDRRPNVTEEVAWKRLRLYCVENNVKIESLRLKFRSNIVTIGEKQDLNEGYYFSYGVTKKIDEKFPINYYILGYCKKGSLHCKWYKIPELIETSSKNRKISEEDIQNQCFIFN